MIAAVNCPDSFFIGAKGAMSSRNPKKKIRMRDVMINRCCFSKYGAAPRVKENIIAAKTATPPSKGVFLTCSFLSFGSSNNCRRAAIRIIVGIDPNAITKAVMKQIRKNIYNFLFQKSK
jgi:hypothetical protein